MTHSFWLRGWAFSPQTGVPSTFDHTQPAAEDVQGRSGNTVLGPEKRSASRELKLQENGNEHESCRIGGTRGDGIGHERNVARSVAAFVEHGLGRSKSLGNVSSSITLVEEACGMWLLTRVLEWAWTSAMARACMRAL
jgi:hypothetical protein